VRDRVYDESFPPTNRRDTGVSDPLAIEISDGETTIRLDPNQTADIAHRCVFPLGEPRAGSSELEGQPAYVYRTTEVELRLDPAELLRLLRHELIPAEYLALRRRYGLFFEVHEDFYSSAGEAVQPMSLMAPDGRWEGAFELGAQMLDTHPDMEPTSAFRQAGADQGIPWGAPMGVFVRWALKTWAS
jgi:hypothetical protein